MKPPNLESDDPAKRHAAMEHVLRHRDVSHQQIKAIADKYMARKKKGGTVRDALHLLGKLHATEQIPYLVSLLNYVVSEFEMTAPPTIQGVYPAAGALIFIGLPSINPVLQRLHGEVDDNALAAGAGVLRFVLGRRGALKRIAEEIDGAGRKEKASLARVKELLTDYFMLQ